MFRAGAVPERPQKVGRGPLRSLRPPGEPPRPTRPFAARPAALNKAGFHPVATRWSTGGRSTVFRRPTGGIPAVDQLLTRPHGRNDGRQGRPTYARPRP